MSITIILAILSTFLGLFSVGMVRKNAKDNAEKQAKIEKRESEIQVKNDIIKKKDDENEKIKQAKDSVNKLDSGAAADKLREKWSRD